MENKFSRWIKESSTAVTKYFQAKFIACLIIFIVSGLIFNFVGIKHPFLMGLILALSNIVPTFGIWVGIIILSIVVSFQYPLYILWVMGTGIVLQIIDDFLISPLIVGKAIDLKPIIIVLAVYIGGLIFGFWGLVFAVPVTAIFKITYNIFLTKKDI